MKLLCSSFENKTRLAAASNVPNTLDQIGIHVCTCLMLLIASVVSVLTEKIEVLGENLRSHFSIEEFSPVSLPAQVHLQISLELTELFKVPKFYLSLKYI